MIELPSTKKYEFQEPIVKVVRTDWYRYLEDYAYQWTHDDILHRIRIKKGFEFDGASIPLLAQVVVGKWDLGKGPPGIHDAIYRCGGNFNMALFGIHEKETAHGLTGYYAYHEYWDTNKWKDVGGIWTRTAADRLFGRHMREAGVRRSRRRLAYRAVRIAGRGSWRGR